MVAFEASAPDDESCYWAAMAPDGDCDTGLVDLPREMQVARGQELLRLLGVAVRSDEVVDARFPPAELPSMGGSEEDVVPPPTFLRATRTLHNSEEEALPKNQIDGYESPEDNEMNRSLGSTMDSSGREDNSAGGDADSTYLEDPCMPFRYAGGSWFPESCGYHLGPPWGSMLYGGAGCMDAQDASLFATCPFSGAREARPKGPKTTVMLRNLPSAFTRPAVVELLEDEGFAGCFDFVYAPVDFHSGCSLGYAFVNYVAPSDANRCWRVFQGFKEWGRATDKVCEVTWGEPHQGLVAHVERYRNSPVVHESVPDDWKPAVYVGGVRAEFPPPTKVVKAPKRRSRIVGRV